MGDGRNKRLPLWTAEKSKSTDSTILSPHLLFPFSQVFSVDVHCKSPILVGNLACIVLPMNPLCTKWRARGQVVCLLLIKPFDQSPFSSAHVALWAPPVCSVRQRTLLVQKWSQWDVQLHMCCEIARLSTLLSPPPTLVLPAFVIKVGRKVIYNNNNIYFICYISQWHCFGMAV